VSPEGRRDDVKGNIAAKPQRSAESSIAGLCSLGEEGVDELLSIYLAKCSGIEQQQEPKQHEAKAAWQVRVVPLH